MLSEQILQVRNNGKEKPKDFGPESVTLVGLHPEVPKTATLKKESSDF